MDSLYQGYPVGYVIAWRNPNVRLKDGSLSEGKKILIDGQQRVTVMLPEFQTKGLVKLQTSNPCSHEHQANPTTSTHQIHYP
jgi:hypothetical protein